MRTKSCPNDSETVARRYPRVVAHLIAESLGYATPSCAARIVFDAIRGRENWCEWIYSCYERDPRKALKAAIQRRCFHKGYMAEYKLAKRLVDVFNATGSQPELASWF